MKILNEKETLYIQKEDLLIIKEEYENVPDFIDQFINSELSDKSFIEITDKGQIGYINLFKWIIDYNIYKDITTDEYNKLYQDYSRNLSKINQEITLGINTSKNLVEKHKVTKQIKDIYIIYQNKYTNNKILLPVTSNPHSIKR